MEFNGLLTFQASKNVIYVKVTREYYASCPEQQVIQVKPGYILIGFNIYDCIPIFSKSSKPEHKCTRTYFPVLDGYKYFEVNDKYKGAEVIFALETDIVVFNGKTVDIYDRDCQTYGRRSGDLPILTEWRAKYVNNPRRIIRTKKSESLLKKVLLREAYLI